MVLVMFESHPFPPLPGAGLSRFGGGGVRWWRWPFPDWARRQVVPPGGCNSGRCGFFEPSELARLALVIYMAYSMSKKGEQLRDFYVGFLPHFLILGLFTGLLLVQPDFGSIVIFAA